MARAGTADGEFASSDAGAPAGEALGDATREPPRLATRTRARLTLALALLGPVFGLATALVLRDAREGIADSALVRTVLLADLAYILVLIGLIAWTISRAVAARRQRSAGAKLHLRLTGLFSLVALAPTIMVALFATLTVNFGMESWFSAQVGSVVRNALQVAQAYEQEHRGSIRGDALAMANDLNRAAGLGIDDAALVELVRQQSILRELPSAYVLDGDGDILARGEFSYLFTLTRPTPEQFAQARAGELVLIDDTENNELRALVHLTSFIDSYLFITRRIEGDVLLLLDETRETVALYERLERERGRVLFDFALLYLGFAALVVLAAVWMGMWLAERLARPIGRLAGAAERVGAGDLDLRVKEEKGDDEVAILSRAFNRMTGQLKGQRDALIDAHRETERRRRFTEAVLSGVSAGVVGLDAQGKVELINGAAAAMLSLDSEAARGRRLCELAPALGELLRRAARTPGGAAQDQTHVVGPSGPRELLARVTPRPDEEGGAVLTIDDMTELVAAQRMAAWGDVARRVAHEIKNPLTPIQLSADRLRSKFRKLAPEDRMALDQYAEVIMRQAADIRRMVDEFSRFARMPEPDQKPEELGAILREAALLLRSAETGVRYVLDLPEVALTAPCDRGLIGQAIGNLLKNATEAVQARLAEEAGVADAAVGEVRVSLARVGGGAVIEIADNGVGLPETGVERLTEPYVTTRAKGTGLGLAIVKKIVEQHGGALTLAPAPPFAEGARRGALARVFLPMGGADASPQQHGHVTA
ncbi:MAG: PAS domain-containing sensor histidine kinase [Rubrimonas sp.]|uniref:sensor histidine kinase NtrY-like n=1 Tax=Rubrimonas sp. TaxID=2036015 RepID=UPI002FDEDF63